MIKLIVFLGNPGQEYRNTRHSVAFRLFDSMTENESLSNKFHSLYAAKDGLKLIKPMTYMNRSGIAVAEAASFYKLMPDEILVCHDDSELDTGRILLQQGGSLKGHNGLKSIKERLGTEAFHRLRIGIGRPSHGPLRAHVLSAFTADEKPLIDQALREAERSIYCCK